MISKLLTKICTVLKKPPRYIAQRIIHEVQCQVDRHLAPRRARKLSCAVIRSGFGYRSVAEWWEVLAARQYFVHTRCGVGDVESVCPGEHTRVLAAAECAIKHRVDLLGSGPTDLGIEIDWHRDYKSGHRWVPAYCRDIQYSNPNDSSDVKFPWELSRMQWMIPLGQAYVLTADERYAEMTRDLLRHWIEANPYAYSVNWSCTMEVALRILTWTWFFHVFKHSTAWVDIEFRESFLKALYLHADFASRNLERSDINGNHYTADAAGLVFAGLFFGPAPVAHAWLHLGWNILCDELPQQVFPDGVDFEASTAYHRLVQELFLLPALYRLRLGFDVPGWYRDRVIKMARFTAAYSRPDGSVPLWGDADDARSLPLGGQPINDHRYIVGLVSAVFGADDLRDSFSGPRSEILWLLGANIASTLPDRQLLDEEQNSVAFHHGGFYVLRNRKDHVFVDCGPLGLGGRGGHGHNDLLSFEAVLDGVHLISDCGAYLYTADYSERNRFRSTEYHNTPQVEGEEINRFIRWDYLWTMHDDAAHELCEMELRPDTDRLVVSHTGFQRLNTPVKVVRRFELDHTQHRLTVSDKFEGSGAHRLRVPLHLAPGVVATLPRAGHVILRARDRSFTLAWAPAASWRLCIQPCRISASYGIIEPATALVWQRAGALTELNFAIEPDRAT